MTDKKYKLTISILASNRRETLPKTLKSIKPILDNVSSELIVTDTGCDDELLGVIKGYTDKLIEFAWCNDFAKARNVGLKQAQGEWFMFLDDDEWFEDVKPIIEFFNSGEADKYNQFYYIQRNYHDKSGGSWQDSYVDRGIRLCGDIEFVDVIHEHYSRRLNPIRLIAAYVHHYGYVYETEEARRKHCERNLALLEKQMSEGDYSQRMYIHMLQEYDTLGEHGRAYDVALQGIEKAKLSGRADRRMLSSIKVNSIYSLFRLKRDNELIEKAKQYLSEGGLTLSAYCAINAYLVYAYREAGALDGVIEATLEYFSIRKLLEHNRTQRDYDSLLATGLVYSGTIPNGIYNMGLMSAVERGDEVAAVAIMRNVVYVDSLTQPDEADWLLKLTRLLAVSKDKAELAGAMSAYISRLKESGEQMNTNI